MPFLLLSTLAVEPTADTLRETVIPLAANAVAAILLLIVMLMTIRWQRKSLKGEGIASLRTIIRTVPQLTAIVLASFLFGGRLAGVFGLICALVTCWFLRLALRTEWPVVKAALQYRGITKKTCARTWLTLIAYLLIAAVAVFAAIHVVIFIVCAVAAVWIVSILWDYLHI